MKNTYNLTSVSTVGLVINAAAFYQDEQFKDWLNNKDRKFTWHDGGEPSEWSDVVVLVEPNLEGEGSDSDMPEAIWAAILEECRSKIGANQSQSHIVVRLVNA